jgi:hypothetical protein
MQTKSTNRNPDRTRNGDLEIIEPPSRTRVPYPYESPGDCKTSAAEQIRLRDERRRLAQQRCDLTDLEDKRRY